MMVAGAHTGLDIAVVVGGVESQDFIRCHIHSGKNHVEIFRFTGAQVVVGAAKNGRLGDFAQRWSTQNLGVANDILHGNLFQLARFAVYNSVFVIAKFYHDLIPVVIRWGVIPGCWLTTVIHYFSSEFEGRVSGVSVQPCRWPEEWPV